MLSDKTRINILARRHVEYRTRTNSGIQVIRVYDGPSPRIMAFCEDIHGGIHVEPMSLTLEDAKFYFNHARETLDNQS